MADNKYIKIPYDFGTKELLLMRSTIKKIFLKNILFSIKSLIGFLIFCIIIPFIPNRRIASSFEPLTSVSDYFIKLCHVWFGIFSLYVFIIFLSTIVTYLKTQLDIRLGYKKVGNFKITKIFDDGNMKIIRLTRGNKLKVFNLDFNYTYLNVGQSLNIQKTATNKFINYKINE